MRPAALALSLLLAAQGSTLKQLGGGALGGATFAFIAADAAWLTRTGGWPLAASAGVAWTFGAGFGAGIAQDEQRLIIGIPATVVLPLVMAVVANVFARPVDDSAG